MATYGDLEYFRIRRRSGGCTPVEGSPCCLVDTRLGDDDGQLVGIPCSICSGCSTIQTYLQLIQQKISQSLLSTFPSLDRTFIETAAVDFSDFVRGLNAKYPCTGPHHVHGAITIVVEIDVRHPLMTITSEDSALIRVSFEEAQPSMKPATVKFVEELVEARSKEMIQEGERFECCWSPVDCVICMDKIETRSGALSMPCSHLFHDGCLRQWLKNSNVCPLCRYEMPCKN